MKQIVLLQGMGNNEQGWARLASSFGRVTLIQGGLIEHVEVWEKGQRVFSGPNLDISSRRTLDDICFGMLGLTRMLCLSCKLTRKTKIDLIIAATYSTGLAALILRGVGKAGAVVSLLTDYLPLRGSLPVKAHRAVTLFLSRFVARQADEVWRVSPRIPTAEVNPRNHVIPLVIDDNHCPPGERKEIAYIGFPSPDHALDVLFDVCQRRQLRLNLIGQSPYLETIRNQAPPGTVFHGLLNDREKIDEVLKRCFCGYAIYRNTGPQSYSYYGIPSKSLYYFASNVPVVTTNTAHFTSNIEKYGVGRVVEPQADQIEKAILELRDGYPAYYKAIDRFRTEWNAQVEKFHRERLTCLLKLEPSPGC